MRMRIEQSRCEADINKRGRLLANSNIDEPLAIGRVRILCCSFATFLDRKRDVAEWVVERVELSSGIERELGRVHVPVNDLGVGVAKSAGGSRSLGCVKRSSVVRVERR